MSDSQLFPVPPALAKSAWIDAETYEKMYAESIKNPDKFWGDHGKRLDWIKPYTKVKNTTFSGDVAIKWYEDGKLNASANCLDRHLQARGNQTAIIWEGDDPKQDARITYKELHRQVCKIANVMKSHGVQKGDRVTIYMPMISRSGLRHARLRAHRRGPLGGVRRLFRPTASPAASKIAIRATSSRPTKACAAARRSRSRPTPTKR